MVAPGALLLKFVEDVKSQKGISTTTGWKYNVSLFIGFSWAKSDPKGRFESFAFVDYIWLGGLG